MGGYLLEGDTVGGLLELNQEWLKSRKKHNSDGSKEFNQKNLLSSEGVKVSV